MARTALAGLLLALAPVAASACEFHGGPFGLAFARMMHAGTEAAAPTTPEAQAEAQAAALATLRAQFLQRFQVRVEGEPLPAGAPAPAPAPTPATPPAVPAPPAPERVTP